MQSPPPATTEPAWLVDDRFMEPVAAGHLIGSSTAGGAVRLGADVEGRLAVDHDALRIRCPREPGWARHGIAYGPFDCAHGWRSSRSC